jgi:tRNA threonylcarbamoyladenosine biosynthesis protein TsaB
MLVLALDTTTRSGSVALVEERPGDPYRTHAERLPGDALALLAAHRTPLASIDLFAVASGPGSFTGLRIGIATMQGFAFVSGRRMVAVSALDALGQIASVDRPAGAMVAVWMDAHRRDVFAALYRVTPAVLFEPDRLIGTDGPLVGEPAATLAGWLPALEAADVSWIGDGAAAFGDTIARCLPRAAILPHPALAGAIGRMAAARARRGDSVNPAAVHPLYLRRPDAEIDRERRAIAAVDAKKAKGVADR